MNIIELQKLDWKPVNSYKTYADSEIVFASISLIKDLIDCYSTINYTYLVTNKVVIEVMISLDAKVFIMKKKYKFCFKDS